MSSDNNNPLFQGRSRGSEAAMPLVEVFLRAFALRIRGRMVSRSSTDFQVRLATVETRRLSELIKDTEFRDTGVFGLLRFDTLGHGGLAVIQRPVLSRIIGAMLGDDAGSEEAGSDARPLSPVELRIALRIFQDITRDLIATWPRRPVPSIELEGSPGNARVMDGKSTDEEMYSAVLDFGPAEAPYGLMCVAIPSQTLRGIGSPTRPERKKSSPKGPDFARVMPLEIELVGEMARLPMRVRDLRALRHGDLLPMGALQGAILRVNDRPVVIGEAGHANGQRSVRVLRKLAD
jgi:flagellar motor switch protein FliM